MGVKDVLFTLKEAYNGYIAAKLDDDMVCGISLLLLLREQGLALLCAKLKFKNILRTLCGFCRAFVI